MLKSKSKYYLDIFQVQVQSLCYVLKSKSKYMSLYLSTSAVELHNMSLVRSMTEIVLRFTRFTNQFLPMKLIEI